MHAAVLRDEDEREFLRHVAKCLRYAGQPRPYKQKRPARAVIVAHVTSNFCLLTSDFS